MKKKDKRKYKLLVHCQLYQIRKGFEEYIKSLPVSFDIYYANLSEEGILSKLRFVPHIIVVLPNEGDSDYSLPFKIKLFAPSIPLLVILPKIPESYLAHLKEIGVAEVIQLPTDNEAIGHTIAKMLDL